MDNFDYKKYLAEGRLLKEDTESINITPQQKRDFINQIKYFIKDEDFNTAMRNAGSILARILTNDEAEFIEDVEDFGYNPDEVEEYAQDLVGNSKLLKENLTDRAEELEMDFMDPRNKFGDEWQEQVSNVLVRKYDGHWENWENENPKELEMLLNKFKNLAEGRLLKEDFSITGEYEGEPVINSGEDLEDYLRGIMVHANSGEDFVRKVEYGITDETSSISEEDKEKLIQFYEDNETSKGGEFEEVNEVEIDSKSEKWDSLSDEDRETALLSAIEDPDNAQEYIDFRYEDLPSEVTSNMIFEDEDGGDIISVAKSILKDQPMDINNYLNSLRNDIRLNGSEGYIEFGDDDWVEDYEEYMADRARA